MVHNLEAEIAGLTERLDRLERRELRLREFVVPAVWNTLDRLYARTPEPPCATCLACGLEGPIEGYGRLQEACIFGGGGLERLSCPRCECVFGPLKYLQTPQPLVAADYRLLYEHYCEGDSTEAELRAFELLKPRRDGLYLNWGSGAWSGTVDKLRAEGYDVWGFEPNAVTQSPFVVEHREGVSARFDGIFSNNVIEHFFDPAEMFRDMASLLKPRGTMVHASPCYAWSCAYTRFHVFFPVGDAPNALAKRTGFQLTQAIDDGEFRARIFARVD